MCRFAKAEFEKRESVLLRQIQHKTHEAEAHRANEKRRLQEVVVTARAGLAGVLYAFTAVIINLPRGSRIARQLILVLSLIIFLNVHNERGKRAAAQPPK